MSVAVSGALAWIIYARLRQDAASRHANMVSALRQRVATLDSLSTKLSGDLRELEKATPTKLAAEVAALADAVDRLAETHRRFAGRVWQRIGADTAAVPNGDTEDHELGAVLALQTAKPAGP